MAKGCEGGIMTVLAVIHFFAKGPHSEVTNEQHVKEVGTNREHTRYHSKSSIGQSKVSELTLMPKK